MFMYYDYEVLNRSIYTTMSVCVVLMSLVGASYVENLVSVVVCIAGEDKCLLMNRGRDGGRGRRN